MQSKKNIKKIIELSYKYRLGHIPSALSISPIVDSLYSQKPNIPIVLGKSFGLQAWLIDESVENFYKQNRHYRILTPEFFTNSSLNVIYAQQQLGLAAGFATGYSIGTKKSSICILSDADFHITSTVSAFEQACKHNAPVHFIIDYNQEQLFSSRDLNWIIESKKEFFDLHIYSCYDNIILDNIERTTVSIVKTIKGFGCERMTKHPKDWHYRILTETDYTDIMNELENV